MNGQRVILVTGGAGFIGSAVVRHIIQDTNDIVINVDKLTYAGNLDNIAEVSGNPRYFFERVDICDCPAILISSSASSPCGTCTYFVRAVCS